MKVLAIASVALKRLFRDRSNIFFVLVLPFGIILIIGSMFGGGGGGYEVGVINEGSGPLSIALVESLADADSYTITMYESPDAAQLDTERGVLTGALTIPAGYDETLLRGEPTSVQLIAPSGQTGPQLSAAISAAVGRQNETLRAAWFLADEGDIPIESALTTVSAIEIEPTSIETEAVGEAIFPASFGAFDLGASGQLILFMFLTGLTGSAAIIQNRTLGTAKRMLSTPTSATTIVAGEWLGRFFVVMFQGVYIVLATLALGVNWGDPLGAMAIIVLFGAVSAGTAVVMGSVFKNDQQAGGIGVMAGLGLAALGGAMIPIEFYTDAMSRVAHFTPHAWAIDGFAELVRRDGGIGDIATELVVLAGFALVTVAVGAWRLRVVLSRE